MTNAKTKRNQLRAAILETADGMHKAGIISEETFRKITVRQMGPDAPPQPSRSAEKKSALCGSALI